MYQNRATTDAESGWLWTLSNIHMVLRGKASEGEIVLLGFRIHFWKFRKFS